MSGGEIFGERPGRNLKESTLKSDFSSFIARKFSQNLKYNYPGFDLFDKNNSGSLSKREWLKVFHPSLNYNDFFEILSSSA